MECSRVEVVLQERTVAIGTQNALMHMSDHFGVHAIFDVRARGTIQGLTLETGEAESLSASGFRIEATHEELLGHVLVALQHYSTRMKTRSWRMTMVLTPLLFCAALALWTLLPLWVDGQSIPRWGVGVSSLVLSMLSSAWVICFGYGFLYGGESIAAFVNAIQEVELALTQARGCSKPLEAASAQPEQNHGAICLV